MVDSIFRFFLPCFNSAFLQYCYTQYLTWNHCKSKHLFSHPQEVSIFVFDKKSVDKLHKPKRKEAMTELLKNGLGHLQCYRHPKLLLGAFHSSLNVNQQGKVDNYLFLLNYNSQLLSGKVHSKKIVLIHHFSDFPRHTYLIIYFPRE